MNNRIVTSYKNPDIDGVASSIALSYYLKEVEGISAKPAICGDIDSETHFVMDLFGILLPSPITAFDSIDAIYLVDTHHLNQIHPKIKPEKVIRIYDHHPSGDPDAFAIAQIINEKVGAVATLMVELFKKKDILLDTNLASLLYAAIISNTLDFSAPTTSERDHCAAEWLSSKTLIPSNLAEKMFEAKSNILDGNTREILLKDYKEFEFSGIKIGIAQIEGIDVQKLFLKSDLALEMSKLCFENGSIHFFLTAVDIREQKTYMFSHMKETQIMLEEAIQAKFSNHIAVFDRILLRKSDIIPALKKHFQ